MKHLQAIVVGLVGIIGVDAQAATLFWDADGAAPYAGGAGTWNTTDARWVASSGATSGHAVWNNAASPADSARFESPAGVVALGGPITVNQITTALSGYTIGNGNGVGGAGNTLTFSGDNSGIDTLHATGTTTLTALLSGTITKLGPGRMELNNSANPNTNKYVLKAGALTAPAPSRFGAVAPASLVQDFITFDGGGFGTNTTTAFDLGTTRGITIKAGGAFFGAFANTIVLTVGAPIVGTEGGDLTITGAGPFVGSGHNSGGVLNLTNTGNSWDGDVFISGTSGSHLRLGASGVIPDTAVVNLSVAGTSFDLATNNVTETVKSIAGTAGTIALGGGSLTVANPAGESYSAAITATTAGKFIKNGTGALSLSGSSTSFGGEMVLNAGTLGVGGNNSLGAAASGSMFTINGGNLSNTGSTARSIPATVNVNLNGNFSADASLFGPTPGQILFNGPATIKNSNRTITVAAAANLGFGGAIGQDVAGRSLTKAGDGILAMNGVNTYSGSTTISAGRIDLDADGTLGNGAGTLNLAGGRLNTTADRSVTTAPVANPVNVTASSEITTTSAASEVQVNFTSNTIGGTAGTLTIRNDGADSVNPNTPDVFKPRFSGSGFDFGRPMVLDNGSAAGGKTELNLFNGAFTTQTFSGVISGNGSIRRSATLASDAGTTTLTGNNTYTGGTSVFRGTLLVNNTSGSGTGSGPLNVRGALDTGIGSGVLGGTGTIGGPVTVELGGTLAPGASIGTLTLDGSATGHPMLTLATDAKLSFELDNTAQADKILLTNGGIGDIVFNNNVIDFIDLSAGGNTLANGNYVLFSAADIGFYTGLTFTGDTISMGLSIGSGLEDYATKSLKRSGTDIVLSIGAAPANLGDFNLDGKVDAADYVIWRDTIGTQVKYDEWKANFGNTYPGSGATVGGGVASSASLVPEPTSLLLVVLGVNGVALNVRRRRR